MIRLDDYVHLAKLRLDWAEVGINRLEMLVDNFLSSNPSELSTTVNQEGKTAHITYTLRVFSQPSPEIRFAAGDVIHNLRATLDNLVSGIRKNYKSRKKISLEFKKSKNEFLKYYVPQIEVLPKPIYDWIESIQPFHRGHYIKSFHILNQLWNLDKHNESIIILTAGLANTGVKDYHFSVKMQFNVRASGQKDQEKIVEAFVPWERRNDYKPGFEPIVAFDKNGPVGLDIMKRPRNVVPYLRSVHRNIVAEVIPKFEPYTGRR